MLRVCMFDTIKLFVKTEVQLYHRERHQRCTLQDTFWVLWKEIQQSDNVFPTDGNCFKSCCYKLSNVFLMELQMLESVFYPSIYYLLNTCYTIHSILLVIRHEYKFRTHRPVEQSVCRSWTRWGVIASARFSLYCHLISVDKHKTAVYHHMYLLWTEGLKAFLDVEKQTLRCKQIVRNWESLTGEKADWVLTLTFIQVWPREHLTFLATAG